MSLYDALLSAAGLAADRAAVRIVTRYEPVGGPGSRVFPPTYPIESKYLIGDRFVDGQRRPDVLLDGTASQANRCEEALLRARREGAVALPLLEIRHSGDVEVTLTSLQFPHRYADAYLRDSQLDGVDFDKTELGKAFQAASLADATALFVHDPGSLVYGAWNSHRKGRQMKFPRVYASEVVGWDPVLVARAAGRMDPMNLIGGAKPTKDGWEYTAAGEKVKGGRLSEIGHGNIAPNPQHGGVTISSATRVATLSFAALDRLGFGSASRDAAVSARAALAAYALLADRLAFAGPSLWLRSGCELLLTEERIEWVGRGGSAERFELTRATALDLFTTAVERAAKEGVELSTGTVTLTPSASLAKAIDFSLTKAESAE